jgi:hypothetical protein
MVRHFKNDEMSSDADSKLVLHPNMESITALNLRLAKKLGEMQTDGNAADSPKYPKGSTYEWSPAGTGNLMTRSIKIIKNTGTETTPVLTSAAVTRAIGTTNENTGLLPKTSFDEF